MHSYPTALVARRRLWTTFVVSSGRDVLRALLQIEKRKSTLTPARVGGDLQRAAIAGRSRPAWAGRSPCGGYTRSCGVYGMRIALISDVHGSELALNAVLADIARTGVDQIVCLGDTATLGPRPREVLERLAELRCICILGNHDEF